MRDAIKVVYNIGDDVALHDLLVVNIKYHLYVGVIHLADDFKCLDC